MQLARCDCLFGPAGSKSCTGIIDANAALCAGCEAAGGEWVDWDTACMGPFNGFGLGNCLIFDMCRRKY